MRYSVNSFYRLPGIILSLIAAIGSGCAGTPETPEPEAPKSVTISDTVELSAVVTAIDQKTRLVTVRGPEGNQLTFQAGPEVRNLPQVKVDDVIVLTYDQIYVATLTDAESMSPDVLLDVGGGRAAEGERPGGMIGTSATVMIRIESVGPDGRSLTYAGPDEELRAMDLEREEAQAFARTLSPGDIVQLEYIEALAITVQPLDN